MANPIQIIMAEFEEFETFRWRVLLWHSINLKIRRDSWSKVGANRSNAKEEDGLKAEGQSKCYRFSDNIDLTFHWTILENGEGLC